MEAIRALVSKPEGQDGHWMWLGTMRRCKGGYLLPWVSIDHNRVAGSAARYIREFEGQKLVGTSLMHRACDEEYCVNPAHWLPGRKDQGPRYRPSKGTKNVVAATQEMATEFVRLFRRVEETLQWHARNWESAAKSLGEIKLRLDSFDASLRRIASAQLGALDVRPLPAAPAPPPPEPAPPAPPAPVVTSLAGAFERAMGLTNIVFDETPLGEALDIAVRNEGGSGKAGAALFARWMDHYKEWTTERGLSPSPNAFLGYVRTYGTT